MIDHIKSERVDNLRRQLADYLADEITKHQYTAEEVAIATTQLLSGITVALPGEIVENIRWVIDNYTSAVSQMSEEVGFSAMVVEMADGVEH